MVVVNEEGEGEQQNRLAKRGGSGDLTKWSSCTSFGKSRHTLALVNEGDDIC